MFLPNSVARQKGIPASNSKVCLDSSDAESLDYTGFNLSIYPGWSNFVLSKLIVEYCGYTISKSQEEEVLFIIIIIIPYIHTYRIITVCSIYSMCRELGSSTTLTTLCTDDKANGLQVTAEKTLSKEADSLGSTHY